MHSNSTGNSNIDINMNINIHIKTNINMHSHIHTDIHIDIHMKVSMNMNIDINILLFQQRTMSRASAFRTFGAWRARNVDARARATVLCRIIVIESGTCRLRSP